MQHLEISGAVRPLKWSLGVKWINTPVTVFYIFPSYTTVYIKITQLRVKI